MTGVVWYDLQKAILHQPTPMTSTTPSSNTTMDFDNKDKILVSEDFYIGLTLAICSSGFIGSSFVVKKQALIKISSYAVRAGDGGHAYLKEWLWWAGFILLGLGELCNFMAYAFAPATLVTPLGALSVIVSAVLSSYCLNETLNLLGKIGCLLCIMGSIVIVLHTPTDEAGHTLSWLAKRLQSPSFISYVCLVVISCLVLIFAISPRWGQSNIIIYILICSLVGSLTVMACKGVGIAIIQFFDGTNTLASPLTWILIILMIVFITIQMHYLNKSLDIFNTAVVTPIYYVFFTASVLVASSLLFQDWRRMTATDVIGALDGFGVVISGIFLLHTFRDLSMSLKDLPSTGKMTTTTSSCAASIHEPRLDTNDCCINVESVSLLNDLSIQNDILSDQEMA
ncbi:magnesium transporter NIPA2-like [Lytechinus variegatus]|uniref:magnesium transporter NIPA2-like n=1 Tax=Lytechinus variegatus TaxID=7654 RepID=UPI001BB1DC3C|nr:magnesium transporter NIPA2-like [Lytechinus variegatus]XP_041462152.1 magnesium transporter NIPA2-like [Lytechinus variegatus]